MKIRKSQTKSFKTLSPETVFLTEICNLDVESVIEEQVFRLQVSVDDVVAVAVLDARHDLRQIL
jgi:hypothetical protein